MANISSAGLGSGIDVNGLISQLVAAEGQPKLQKLDRDELTTQV